MRKKTQDGGIDVGSLFFKLRSRWHYFAITIPLALAVAYFYNSTADKVYKFESTIQVNPKRTGSKSTDQQLSNTLEKSELRNITDEIGIVSSYDLVKKAIQKLDFGISYYVEDDFGKKEIYGNIPFQVILDSSVNQLINVPIYVDIKSKDEYALEIEAEDAKVFNFKTQKPLEDRIPAAKVRSKMKFGKSYQHKYFGLKIQLNKLPNSGSNKKMYFVINDISSVARTYHRKLIVVPIARDSYVLDLTSQGSVPEKEIKFLNTLMQVYIEKDLYEKNRTGQLTLDFINRKLDEADRNLITSESAIEQFKSTKSIMSIKEISDQAIKNLDNFEGDRINLELKLDNYKNLYQYLITNENQDNFVTPSNADASDNTTNLLLTQLSNKNREKVALAITAKKDNPKMLAIEEEIKSINKILKEYLQNTIKSTQSSLNSIVRRINTIQGKITQMPTDNRELDDLERDLLFNKNNYELLLKKRSDAQITLASNTPDIKVVDEAKMEGTGPISPNTRLIYLMALFFSVTIPIVIILIQNYLDEKIKTKEEIEDNTDIPLLTMIAKSDKKTKLVLLEQPNSLIAESFRLLKIKLAHYDEDLNNKIIGITSTIGGEGKTFCAVNLSLAYALSSNKTLLLIADLHKNQPSEYFELDEIGLSSYLNQEVEMDSIVQSTKIPFLDVIGCGPQPLNPAELLGKPEMGDLLDELRKRYAYIIVDTPPIGYVSDYLMLKDYIDTTIYLTRYNYSKKRMLNEINELYESNTLKNISIVFNDVNYKSVYELRFKEGKYVHEKEI